MIKVYYDGKCGICRDEMAHYQRVAPLGVFEWVDIMGEPGPLLPPGLSLVDALKVLHVQDDQGKMYKELDAFLVIWRQLPRFRWLSRLLSVPGIHYVARKIYCAFAFVRFKWMGYGRCPLPGSGAKACVVQRPQESIMSIHAFSISTINGETKSLADLRGQVVLIVNTASRCGFTSQYRGLEELYQRYKDRGFVVLAFPANNFMGQEPGSDTEIRNFCELKYKTSFPLFAKTSVKGKDINPLFKYLTQDSAFKGPVTWNFNKFLADGRGQVIARFDSRCDPLDPRLVAAVEKALSSKDP